MGLGGTVNSVVSFRRKRSDATGATASGPVSTSPESSDELPVSIFTACAASPARIALTKTPINFQNRALSADPGGVLSPWPGGVVDVPPAGGPHAQLGQNQGEGEHENIGDTDFRRADCGGFVVQ